MAKQHHFHRISDRRLGIEALETRRLPAVFSVSNLNDAGPGSLRYAIAQANNSDGADEINFSVSGTIFLTSGELEVSQTLTIAGLSQEILSIDAQQNSRIINYSSPVGDLELSNLHLRNGMEVGDGGGLLFQSSGVVKMTSVTLVGNVAKGSNHAGGGLSAVGGAVELVDSRVEDNNSTGGGGGVLAQSVSLIRSKVSGNTSSSGGGIYASTIEIVQSSVSNNRAASFGGGVVVHNPIMVKQSTVSGNAATYRGGGILSFSGATLLQSTVSGNRVEETSFVDAMGGGVSSGGSVHVVQSTVTNNSALGPNSDGGGIHQLDGAEDFPVTVRNSILVGNTATGTAKNYKVDPESAHTVMHSLIGTDVFTAGLNNVVAETTESLGPLANNGGLTKTHALLPGSPAIDAGDPAILFDENEFDQRGSPFSRVADGSLISGIAVDIGAYEAQAVPTGDFDSDRDVDGSDFLAWQRGHGKDSATRANGNSDDDTDVDASDLVAWIVSYGQEQPQIDQSIAYRQQASDGELLVLAYGIFPSDEVFSEARKHIDAPRRHDYYFISAGESVGRAGEPLAIYARRPSTLDAQKIEATAMSTNRSWLSEELLERVFSESNSTLIREL